MKLPYEINYHASAQEKGVYANQFHAEVEKMKDCYIWAWILKNGTGFEAMTYFDASEENPVQYYMVVPHSNYDSGRYSKQGAYHVNLSPEAMIEVMTGGYKAIGEGELNTSRKNKDGWHGYKREVNDMAKQFCNTLTSFLEHSPALTIHNIALKIDFYSEVISLIHKSEVKDSMIPF